MSQETWVETTCDRCGKLDRSDELVNGQMPRGWRSLETMDLCELCLTSFAEWKTPTKDVAHVGIGVGGEQKEGVA